MLLAEDLVSDTPTHNAANYGVPAYPHCTCSGNPVEMTMNYMDYTDDRGMFMFSNGQKIKNSYFSFRWSESIIQEYNYFWPNSVLKDSGFVSWNF
jgi:hypothetical protein